MEKAKRARKAETPKQPSLCLRLRAPYLYPDPTATSAAIQLCHFDAAFVSGRRDLFARPVATLPFSLEQGFLGGCQGAWLDPDRHLLEFAAEAERDLIIPIVHWRAGIGTDVQRLVPLQSEGNCPVHRLGSDDLAIDLEHTGATTTDTAHVVEGQRGEAKPVVFEVELEGVLARRQCLLALPAHTLQVEQVPDVDGLTLEDVKAPASEATALCGDHAVAGLRRAKP